MDESFSDRMTVKEEEHPGFQYVLPQFYALVQPAQFDGQVQFDPQTQILPWDNSSNNFNQINNSISYYSPYQPIPKPNQYYMNAQFVGGGIYGYPEAAGRVSYPPPPDGFTVNPVMSNIDDFVDPMLLGGYGSMPYVQPDFSLRPQIPQPVMQPHMNFSFYPEPLQMEHGHETQPPELPPLPLRVAEESGRASSPPPTSHSVRLRQQHQDRCEHLHIPPQKSPTQKQAPAPAPAQGQSQAKVLRKSIRSNINKKKEYGAVQVKVPFSKASSPPPLPKTGTTTRSKSNQEQNNPPFDIEAFVNRPASERMHESTGRVARPLNAFMLYRKMFADAAHRRIILMTQDDQDDKSARKKKCMQQAMSQMLGESWRLEDEATKDKFREYAYVEKMNHDRAYPDYKYAPRRPGQAAGAKRKAAAAVAKDDDEEVEDDEEEEDDVDGEEYGASLERFVRKRVKRE
ncbi:hypothetical protein F5Y17DRAFT_53034 [Xylariaceae sp. FL0594]|nr:hypothetical protein F5Y17DRAFT_53034 [Xylariaceae sp. FL0594]